MTLPTENTAFGGDEMIACGNCGKMNPPNRAGCLYCGAALDLPDDRRAGLKLNFRKLENWENGFNVVLLSREEKPDAAAAARYLRYDEELFGRMLKAVEPFPLARLASETDAAAAAEELGRCGFVTRVVRDVELKIGKPSIRLRSLGFAGDSLVLTTFNTGERKTVHGPDVALIVVGRIVESRRESVEKGRRDKRKVLAESATASDDLLIDIYLADSPQGWRVTTKGFDFSTLGSEKRLIAVENIRLLLEKLKALAPAAKVVDEYADLIEPLTEVWDIERRTDFEGMKRTGVLRQGFASVARTSNMEQFSKYSKLQRLLLGRGHSGSGE